MPRIVERYGETLRTDLIRGRSGRERITRTRAVRIKEALSWEPGTQEEPLKHVVDELPSGFEAYFLKPGKEAFRERPNIHDMAPNVGNIYDGARFDNIWVPLSRTSVIDFELFKAILVLLYRNAYFYDHADIGKGRFRYRPQGQMMKCIMEIDKEIKGVLPKAGLLGLLSFLDLLGWNEDVKYHTENGEPVFNGRYGYNVGRLNTFLTCIRVPYQLSEFVSNVLDNAEERSKIDFGLGLDTMQQFAKARGTCVPTQVQLVEWLAPYLIRD